MNSLAELLLYSHKKKARFLLSSCTATSVDYFLYLILCVFMYPVFANAVSYSSGFLTNFTLQKIFVFEQTRKTQTVFFMAIVQAFFGLLLSSLLIFLINLVPFFLERQHITKLLVICIMFFYNFIGRAYIFGDTSRA